MARWKTFRPAGLACIGAALLNCAYAEDAPDKTLDAVVVSASRSEQRQFDAPAAVDSLPVRAFEHAGPLVNLSELTASVPGMAVRDRQNHAQDLQVSIRGFGTRSTFGVRGVRILIDGIPATMPDGQGQAATASLASAKRIEILRGPVAQLYGNAAGGVIQVFTKDPPFGAGPIANVSAGAGSYGQRQLEAGIAGGSASLGGVLNVMHYQTDGYRDHSAAERTQINGKAVWKLSSETTLTGIVNSFNQPLAQDPLGLSRAQFEQNPRQVVAGALFFDTRKKIENQQTGLLLEHKLTAGDTLNARVYDGTRKVTQMLATSGSAVGSSGGVVNLDNDFHGTEIFWTHTAKANGLPLGWTVGVDSDALKQWRRGFVNNNGTAGALRRDEIDRASNIDLFGQFEWTMHPQWKTSLGLRSSRVRLAVEDHYVTSASPDDSGSAEYRKTNPVLGAVWSARDDLNVYANLGRGFETPTLTEIAYRPGAVGTNFALRPSRSTQGEIGAKWRSGKHSVDVALFQSRSSDEIVPYTNDNGRSTFQNVDQVERRGIETSWKADWGRFSTQLAYTLLDASFGKSYTGSSGTVAAGNRLPGAPQHTLFTQVEYRPMQDLTLGAEMRVESKVYVNDTNSEAAPGYALFNVRAGYAFQAGSHKAFAFVRLDNLLDRRYAGSVIVNEANRRFYEAAAERRLFAGVRTVF